MIMERTNSTGNLSGMNRNGSTDVIVHSSPTEDNVEISQVSTRRSAQTNGMKNSNNKSIHVGDGVDDGNGTLEAHLTNNGHLIANNTVSNDMESIPPHSNYLPEITRSFSGRSICDLSEDVFKKSESTISLSDYVNSSTLLKSPSTNSLTAMHKSSSASSLTELHAASLLKSSSSASFSKYQEEMERDELNFDSYATGNADIASSTSTNSNMSYENLTNHHHQHNNNNNNNGHSQSHVNISAMIYRHYSPTPNLQGYRMNSIGQLPSNGLSPSMDAFPHLNYLSGNNLPVNSPMGSSLTPLSMIVNASDSMHFPGIRHHGSQLSSTSIHMTQDASPLISTFEQFDRKQSEEQHPM